MHVLIIQLCLHCNDSTGAAWHRQQNVQPYLQNTHQPFPSFSSSLFRELAQHAVVSSLCPWHAKTLDGFSILNNDPAHEPDAALTAAYCLRL